MNQKLYLILFTVIIFSTMVSSCIKRIPEQSPISTPGNPKTFTEKTEVELTILEFGSNCVPCAKMKIILDLLVEEYEGIIAVEYIDIGTDSGEKRAEENMIKIIPSQIILDSNGVEILRHDGYLPQEELLLFLEKQGIKK